MTDLAIKLMNTKPFKNILVVNLGGIGDILLSLPALKALRGLYPQARISMLIVPRVREMMEGSPYVDELFALDVGWGSRFGIVKMFGNARTLFLLRGRRFDIAINMRTLVSDKSAWEMRLLFAVIGPKVKAGRDTEGRGSFFDITVPESDSGDRYEMYYDIEMAKKLGALDVDERVDYRVDEESRKKVLRVLEERGVGENDTLVIVNPGGAPANRWPLERFARAINEIYNRTNAKFVITGGAGEAGLALELGENINADAIDLAGKLSVKELSALIERCDLFITNDTGPMYIAAVLRKPLVAIFGPGHITRYDPRKVSDKAVVVYNKVECAPCNRKACNSMRCLKGIPPDGVVEAALRLLGRT